MPFGEGLFEKPRPCLGAAGSDTFWPELANNEARPWFSSSSPESLVGLLPVLALLDIKDVTQLSTTGEVLKAQDGVEIY